MKGKITIFLCLAMASLSLSAVSPLQQFAARVDDIGPYSATATYSVLLPSASDDIVYEVVLNSEKTTDDQLSPCDYLIDWKLPTPSGTSEGFSAYSSGNHFRYRDERLQEYHFEWDSIPFVTGRGGVQRNAQFADILPQFIAAQLNTIAEDHSYDYRFAPDTIVSGRQVAYLEAVETRNGFIAREMTYVFDAQTAHPLKIEFENNPGAISEQTVTVTFAPAADQAVSAYSEDALIARYPEVFERYRQSNFRVENLPGTALPQISLPTLDGQRYTHHRGERFASPQLIALMDPAVGSVDMTVDEIRSAVAALPMNIDVVYAFVSNNSDLIESVIPKLNAGETALMSARSLARDCGVSSFPTLIFVDRSGIVRDTHLGFNKDLSNIVIQKAAMIDR